MSIHEYCVRDMLRVNQENTAHAVQMVKEYAAAGDRWAACWWAEALERLKAEKKRLENMMGGGEA